MRILTANEAWFSFKGISCRDYSVRMVSPPARLHPSRKGEYIGIPGADGELWFDGGGYDPIFISVHCIAEDNLNIDDINAWLSGKGDLIFGDEPERVYKASITGEYARNNLYGVMRGQEFTVSFDCEPYRYNADPDGDTVTITESETPINNPGTVASLPLLEVEGHGDGNLMIGQNTLLFYDLEANKPIYVDCAAKIAYTGTGAANDPLILATQHLTGEWMSVDPGLNFVTFVGGIRSVTIVPRWRWL